MIDPEQATIADLFRVITEFRAEVRASLKEAADEREAIRRVLTDDTATYDQIKRVEDLVGAQSKEIRDLRRAVNQAGIKV